jgi:hypothetical protein
MGLRMLLAGAALAASAMLPLATAASAVNMPPGTPPDTGCAASFELLEVADLVALGYMVPTYVDEEIGNNDGLVCGKPFPDQCRKTSASPFQGVALSQSFTASETTTCRTLTGGSLPVNRFLLIGPLFHPEWNGPDLSSPGPSRRRQPIHAEAVD